MNVAQLFDRWNTIHRDLLGAVAVRDDGDLVFQPASAYACSIGVILCHITNRRKRLDSLCYSPFLIEMACRRAREI